MINMPVRLRSVLHVIAFAVLILGAFLAAGAALGAIGVHFHDSSNTEYPISILGTIILVIIVFGATALMAYVEHTPMLDYGLRDAGAIRRAAIGATTGLLAFAVLILCLRGAGSIELHAASQPFSISIAYALIWGVGYGLVAFAEENLFRGYPLAALTRVVGAPGAAIATSLIFGLLHLGNGGESWIAATNAVLLALVFAASVYMTGSLWWAIGFHAAWNWTESWLFGAADSGIVAVGRLLEATPRGPRWLSGGAAGPEGSIGMLVAIAIAAFALWRTAETHGAPGTGHRAPTHCRRC
jgi:uncharacterized protein